MIDSPRFQTIKRQARFNSADFLQTFTRKPVASLRTGSDLITVLLMEAVGHDIRISTEARLRIGQQFVVMVKRPEAPGELEIPGIVHWANELTPGEYGIALLESLPNACVIGQPDCQRDSLRYDCRVTGQLRWPAADETSATSVVVNYSRNGICLQVRSVPAIGSRVQFGFTSGSGNHAINGFLRWVIGQNGTFLAGCELVDCLGYEIAGVHISQC